MFKKELKNLSEKSLLRSVKDRASAQGARIIIGKREFINFSSNDYLGLSSDKRLIETAKAALDAYGSGTGASRLLSGGTALHGELEKKLARFKNAPKTLIFNSGYSANTGIIPAIAKEGDAVLSDELNHASIIDGCRLSKAKTFIYRHRDVEHLKELLKKIKAKRKIVATDTVFSMDGDITPLKDISGLCKKYGALLYLDDAHGTGVMAEGKGTLKHFNIKHEPFTIEMGTLSKAIGSFGAFVAGEASAINWITNTARSFIYSTALPASAVAAADAAIDIINKDKNLIKKLWENRALLFNSLKDMGFDTGESETPIIPIIMKDIKSTLRLSKKLYEKGIYAPAIRPPTVERPRIRLTVTAAHTEEDIGMLIETLRKF